MLVHSGTQPRSPYWRITPTLTTRRRPLVVVAGGVKELAVRIGGQGRPWNWEWDAHQWEGRGSLRQALGLLTAAVRTRAGDLAWGGHLRDPVL
ncbi:hypothetical protein ACIBKY_33300 [Nonomuraea sp. NPDC050394]|uniref:hypothetical protein n=1 Tax=Nonomuraea sp. NPDC050394 TaxID=3364363 RepID=UPI0037A29C82